MIPLLLTAALGLAHAEPAPELLLQDRGVIWGFDFLPDGRVLFTERAGTMGLLDPKTGMVEEVRGAPAVWAHEQGGLLDVVLHPDFATNQLVYLAWSHPLEGGEAATAMGRAKLRENELQGFERLLLTNTASKKGWHFGARLVFDGPHLWMSVGERNQRDLAQNLGRHHGKILRLTHDGKPAGSGLSKALPEIWSRGHRNPQGLALRPGTGQLWSAEFGPRGGDELNLIKPRANYGWPIITYGREYWGPPIGTTRKEGMEQPVEHWVPSISPSGMAFLDRDTVALACLKSRHIRLLRLEGDKVAAQRELLKDKWRIRHVRKGPDGKLWFSTDDGKIGRLTLPKL